MQSDTVYTGRCYCGAVRLRAHSAPQTITYCHCTDCRRWTGAPVGAFAAFEETALYFTPELGSSFSRVEGVERWTCQTCGSPLAARFDYLPGQIYVPLGLMDQAADMRPQMHCHYDSRLPWLKISDSLPCALGSGRDTLLSGGQTDQT
ncbi:MAG: GFA family protein [Pseudomonadota bacterium]